METRRPFTRRNVVCAVILGVITFAYGLVMWSIYTGSRSGRGGGDTSGEAGGFAFAILLLPTAYTTMFFLATFSTAVQRGSPPMSYWLLGLGLLPTFLLLLLPLWGVLSS